MATPVTSVYAQYPRVLSLASELSRLALNYLARTRGRDAMSVGMLTEVYR